MKKRVVALGLSTMMALSCLVGCGNDANDETKVSQSESKQESVAESSKESESVQPTEEPKEVREVSWIVRGTKQEDFDKVLDACNEILREKYYLELDLIPVEDAEIAQRVELMLTSNEYYDMNYTNAANFYTNVEREAYLPLNDLLENTEVGQKLMEIYPEGLEDIGTVNGTIYALPNYQKRFTQACAIIPKDIADSYGLDTEKTYNDITDFEDLFEWTLENEPDKFPLRWSGYIYNACQYAEDYYGDEMATVCSVKADGNYEVKLNTEQEAYINTWKLANDYWHKGYVRADQETVTDDTADLMAHRFAVMIDVYKPGVEADYAAKYGGEYVCIPLGKPYVAYNDGIATMTAINASCKDPEAALEMLYVFWTDEEVYNMMLFGLEGEHYTKVSENRVEKVENSKYDMSGKFGWQLGNQFNAWLMPGQADNTWTLTEEINASATQSPLAGFCLDQSTISTELSIVKNAKPAGFMIVDDFDKWLEETHQAILDNYGNEIKTEVQRQIDEWRAANGK